MKTSLKRPSAVRDALMRYKTAFIGVLLLSAVLNILLLGGSIYMMMVYDSVLPSHSLPTLAGLFAMVTLIYIFQGFFDSLRTRILTDIAIGVDRALAARVQHAIGSARLQGAPMSGDGLAAMRDLDSLRGFLSSGGPVALIDLPWMFFFIGVLTMLHVWLGVTALVGAIILLGLAFVTDRATRAPSARLSGIAAARRGLAENSLRHVELLTALGMRKRVGGLWADSNAQYQDVHDQMARTTGVLAGISKMFRLFLQSGLLTVGALLVISGDATGGVIFASSILSGRALAPVELAIANWRGLITARLGWLRMDELLEHFDAAPTKSVALPRPTQNLTVERLSIAPPGANRLTVQDVSFRLNAGQALAVIGPSAAGKSSLARALVGAWRPAAGSVRLDGAALDQWDSEDLGSHIGYLPQTVELLDGTVAQNIARWHPSPDSSALIAAARAAGVHDMIVGLPLGYDTPVGTDGAELSAGQRQRIGLARALFGDPFLVLLDEPNSNLDGEGERALDAAIVSVRARGGIAIIVAHRAAALAHADLALVLRNGRMEAFGPRDEVLAKVAPSVKLSPSPADQSPRLSDTLHALRETRAQKAKV